MARPVVTDTTEEVLAGLGPWGRADGEATGWHLLKFLDAAVSQLDFLNGFIRDDGDDPGWSSLMDIDTVPLWALPWLAQFKGVTVPGGLTEQQQRDLVENASGFRRGTRASLIAAIQTYLTGTKVVNVLERDTSAYHFTVQTYAGQMPIITYAQLASQYATYAALAAAFPQYEDFPNVEDDIDRVIATQKPGGLAYTYTILPGNP